MYFLIAMGYLRRDGFFYFTATGYCYWYVRVHIFSQHILMRTRRIGSEQKDTCRYTQWMCACSKHGRELPYLSQYYSILHHILHHTVGNGLGQFIGSYVMNHVFR